MREMTIADYEEVFALWQQTPGMGLNDVDDSYEGIKRYLERNPHTNFVEVRDDQIVGVIMSGHDGRRGTLHHLAVKEGYKNQGIGNALVQRAIAALKAEGITRVALSVYKDNEGGFAFWRKRGFTYRDDLYYMDYDLVDMQSLISGKRS